MPVFSFASDGERFASETEFAEIAVELKTQTGIDLYNATITDESNVQSIRITTEQAAMIDVWHFPHHADVSSDEEWDK